MHVREGKTNLAADLKRALAQSELVGDAPRVKRANLGKRAFAIRGAFGISAATVLAVLFTGRFIGAASDEPPPAPSTVASATSTPKVVHVVKRKAQDKNKRTKSHDAGVADAAAESAPVAADAGLATQRDSGVPQNNDLDSSAAPSASASGLVPPSTAPSASSAPQLSATPGRTGIEVRIRETVILTLQLSDGGMSAAERAKRANRAIEQALSSSAPKSVRVEPKNARAIVFIGTQPVVELTSDDATVAGEGSLDLYSASVAARISDILHAEENRSQLGKTVQNVVIVILLAVVSLFSLKLIRDWSVRARSWVERNPHRIPAVRLKSIEVVRPPVLRNAALVSLAVVKWIGQIGAIYLWLIASMSFFDSTRGYTEKLTSLVLSPLSTLTSRIAALLPLTVVVALGMVALLILLRFIGLFFAAVERGETQVENLSPTLAAPTSFLVRIGLVVLSLLVLAPVLTGNSDGTFPRLGQLAIAAIALALVPLITTVLIGMRVLYASRLTVGQWVSIGAISGRILELTLFDTRIWVPGGATARVPHLVLLWQTLRTSTGSTNTVRLSIASHEQLEEVVDDLTAIAVRYGADATVTIEALSANQADLVIQVTMPESVSRNSLILDLVRALQDRKIPLAKGRNPS